MIVHENLLLRLAGFAGGDTTLPAREIFNYLNFLVVEILIPSGK
jgi:hypothetical protein